MAKAKPSTNGNGAKPAAEKPLAAYVTSLSVENVRCFGLKQTLDLSDGKGGPARWTIILGENGTGKTTLLQALSCFERRLAYDGFPEGDGRYLTSRLLDPPAGTGPLYSSDSHGFVRLTNGARSGQCTASFSIQPTISWTGRSRSVSEKWEVHAGGGCEFLGTVLRTPFHGYGAGRHLSWGGALPEAQDDSCGTLFSNMAVLRNVEDWLFQLELASLRPSNGQARHQVRLKQVKELLTGGLLIDVDDIRFVSADGPRPVSHVEFHTPYGWVPLRRLGYGYQTLLAWVVDLASRMVERYPDSPDPLKEPAIVVIDEIDLHLHPAWQRKLVPFLTDRFPNAQFIATAHSPLTVQAAEGANLAVLKRVGDHVEIDNRPESVRGWRVDQILTSDLFGLYSSRSPSVDRLYKRNEELALKGRLTTAEKKEFAAIQAELSALPAGDSDAFAKEMAAIKEAIELLKKRSPDDPHRQAGGTNGTGPPRG